jgi:hypothetical protein
LLDFSQQHVIKEKSGLKKSNDRNFLPDIHNNPSMFLKSFGL